MGALLIVLAVVLAGIAGACLAVVRVDHILINKRLDAQAEQLVALRTEFRRFQSASARARTDASTSAGTEGSTSVRTDVRT